MSRTLDEIIDDLRKLTRGKPLQDSLHDIIVDLSDLRHEMLVAATALEPAARCVVEGAMGGGK